MPDKGAKLKIRIAELKKQLAPAALSPSSMEGAGVDKDKDAYVLPDCWVVKTSKSKGKT